MEKLTFWIRLHRGRGVKMTTPARESNHLCESRGGNCWRPLLSKIWSYPYVELPNTESPYAPPSSESNFAMRCGENYTGLIHKNSLETEGQNYWNQVEVNTHQEQNTEMYPSNSPIYLQFAINDLDLWHTNKVTLLTWIWCNLVNSIAYHSLGQKWFFLTNIRIVRASL